MKRTLLLFLFALTCNLYAQDNEEHYVVYEITGGTVMKLAGKDKIEIKEGDNFTSLDKLLISEGTTMVLLELPNFRCTVKGYYTGTIPNYKQRNQNTCVMTITSKYMNYLLKQLETGSKNAKRDLSTSVTVYRGSRRKKSITMPAESIDTLYHIIDSLSPSHPDTVTTPADSK